MLLSYRFKCSLEINTFLGLGNKKHVLKFNVNVNLGGTKRFTINYTSSKLF